MEVTKKDVEKLIELRKQNTFLNHLGTVFSRDMSSNGEIKLNEIKVWKQNMWNVTFYPIFTFTFNDKNHLTKIKDELNPIAKTLIVILFLVFFYVIIPEDLSDFNFNLRLFTVLVTVIFLIICLARVVYKNEKNNQLKEIFEILDIEVEGKDAEKEWSLKNIFIRILTYPFSFFVIAISVWSFFNDGIEGIIRSFFAIGICSIYLYSDIKMILRAKKTTASRVSSKKQS